MAVLNLNYSLVSESAANKVSMPNYVYTDPGKFCTNRELLETVCKYNDKVRDLQLVFAEAVNMPEEVLTEGNILEGVKNFFVGIIKALINLIKDIVKTIVNLIKALIYAIMGKQYNRDEDAKDHEFDYRETLKNALDENPTMIPCADLTANEYLKSSSFPADYATVIDPLEKAIGEMKTFLGNGIDMAPSDDYINYFNDIRNIFNNLSESISYLMFGDFYKAGIEATDTTGAVSKNIAFAAFGSTNIEDVRLSVELYDQARINMATDTRKLVDYYKKMQREVESRSDKLIKDLESLKNIWNTQLNTYNSSYNFDKAKLKSDSINIIMNFSTLIRFTEISYQNLITTKLTRLSQLFGNTSYSAKVIKKCDQIVKAHKAGKEPATVKESARDTEYYCEKFFTEYAMFIEASNEVSFTEQLNMFLEAEENPAQTQQQQPANNTANEQQKAAEDKAKDAEKAKKEDQKAEGFWAKIKAFFKKIWDGIKGLFGKVAEKTQEIISGEDGKWWQDNRTRFIQDKPLAGASYKYSTIPCYDQTVYNNDSLLESSKGTGAEGTYITKAYNHIKNNFDQASSEDQIEALSNMSQEQFTAQLNAEKAKIFDELKFGIKGLENADPKDLDKALTDIYIKIPANNNSVPFNQIPPGNGEKDTPASTANNLYTSMIEYLDNYFGGKAALSTINTEKKMIDDLQARTDKRIGDLEVKVKAHREEIQQQRAQEVMDQTNKNNMATDQSNLINGTDNVKKESFSLADTLGISGSSMLYEAFINEGKFGNAPDPNQQVAAADATVQKLDGSDGTNKATADQHNEDAMKEETKYQNGISRWSDLNRVQLEILSKLVFKRASIAEKAYKEYLENFKAMDGYLEGIKNKAKADQKAAKQQAKDAEAAEKTGVNKKAQEDLAAKGAPESGTGTSVPT